MTRVIKTGDPGAKGKDAVYIGRNSEFGNPYKIAPQITREEVIANFKSYFYRRLGADRHFARKVRELKDKTLVCHCKPLPCHGDIIAEYLNHEMDR